MQKQVFQEQIRRISSVFGRDSYAEERLEVFWFKMKDFTDLEFIEAVNKIIANERRPPMLNDFLRHLPRFDFEA